jgi:hypothetical protein
VNYPLEQALAAVAGRCGGDARQVERVDVDRHGALQLLLRTPAGPRWFDHDGHGCREQMPEQDGALPLAAAMPGLARTGHVEVLAWRPGRRLVLRLDRGGGSLVLKGHRPRRSADAAARHVAASAALAGGQVSAAELLAHDAAGACLTFRRVEGRALLLSAASQEHFFRLGAALREAQARPAPEELPAHGPQDELDLLERLAARVALAACALPAGYAELRERLGTLPPPEPSALVFAHRDLHDRQVLDTGSGLVLLDFDLAARADPLLDAANLLAHLKLRALQGASGASDDSALLLGRALLDGLDGRHDEGFARRLRFYQATTFLRLLLIYRLRPRWTDVLPGLARMAERCLDEARA